MDVRFVAKLATTLRYFFKIYQWDLIFLGVCIQFNKLENKHRCGGSSPCAADIVGDSAAGLSGTSCVWLHPDVTRCSPGHLRPECGRLFSTQ